MRLCRYQIGGRIAAGFYFDDGVIDMQRAAAELGIAVPASAGAGLLDYLPPAGAHAAATSRLFDRLSGLSASDRRQLCIAPDEVVLRRPVAEPSKVVLLAGNYPEHVKEAGGDAAERDATYPYFFLKPPGTYTHPGDPIRIPRISPDHIDWEVELGVVIGRRCRDVSESAALGCVAGYIVCNDVSDRKFRINPGRRPREKDRFFDWLHGKWHDTFLPMGPCILSAVAVADPQQFPLKLRVNGATMQEASTAQMIFPVAAVISVLSSFVTLEPGDVISTGTPHGVGFARKPPIFLRAGDRVDAEIGGIGVLSNPVV